jgi:chromosome segregation ATPase
MSLSQNVDSLRSELIQSRAQRKMLIKELKFVREQLAYHRKQLAKVEAERTEMKADMIELRRRVVEAETDKTRVMTRSIAEKHMLSNEITALEDAFMLNITDKPVAHDQAQAQVIISSLFYIYIFSLNIWDLNCHFTNIDWGFFFDKFLLILFFLQVMMLRKEVRHLRGQFVGVRQELAKERKDNEEAVARYRQEIDDLRAQLQQNNQNDDGTTTEIVVPANHSNRLHDRSPSPHIMPSPKVRFPNTKSHINICKRTISLFYLRCAR